MDLVVSEQEHSEAAGKISAAVEEIACISRSYVACLQGIKTLGYKSTASAAAIDARCAKVQQITQSFVEAVDGLSSETGRHLGALDAIDKTVF